VSLPRHKPLQRHKPVRKFRPTLRRGELTPEEKEAVRLMAYQRAGARCELRIHSECWGFRILPWAGEVMFRAHLVHLRTKQNHGWSEQNVCIGCPICHSHTHTKGVQLPRTYDELKAAA
jgi:hypothetical protein